MLYLSQTQTRPYRLLVITLLAIIYVFSPMAKASHSPDKLTNTALLAKANHIVQQAEAQFEDFDNNKYWDSVKTTTGIAKAIVIFPQSHQAGFILGAQWGHGILLTRNKQKWSSPVFIKFNSYMFGLLAGVQKVQGIGVVLSDEIVTSLLTKPIRISATADLTIAKGVSGKVVGGKEGISALMISENKGLYFGGSMDAIQFRLDHTLNDAVYGNKINLQDLLTHKEVIDYPPAEKLKNSLATASFNAVYNQ